ncbi:2TM domain-containing protein [Changchengzhania lutea]|uniref:2TM domain-containing protein n=1 Tax=Changchengzhania lutea TaxID=2049305 RepID=UPI00115C4B71|nr:2TM domain-containing protein [Changchengzhania lutea]
MKRHQIKTSKESFGKENAYLRAEKRLKELKGFYWHLFWYLAVNIFLIIVILVNSNGDNIWHFGTYTTPFFWGIGLGFHALSVFGKNLIFSKRWEDRKIQEHMDKEKKQWK